MHRYQPYEDLQLFHVRPENERVAAKKRERQRQIDQSQRSLNEVLQIEADSHQPLSPGEVLRDCAEKSKFKHDGSLNVADKLKIVSDRNDVLCSADPATHPSRTLLDVRIVGLRHRAVLQGFWDEACLPTSP